MMRLKKLYRVFMEAVLKFTAYGIGCLSDWTLNLGYWLEHVADMTLELGDGFDHESLEAHKALRKKFEEQDKDEFHF